MDNLIHHENLTLEEAVEAVIAGLSRAENDFDIRANALVCGLKQEPIQKLQKLLPLFDKIPDEHLVGFDMAGDELNYPQEKFVDLIHDIKIKGVNEMLTWSKTDFNIFNIIICCLSDNIISSQL